jgi:Flp pilus assembly protein TadG
MKTKKYAGAAMVEFAIIALLFFTVVFGLIEFARLFFTTNTLNEMTRRGARLATVCYPTASKVTQATLFNTLNSTGTTAALVPSISTSNVRVRYLNASGDDICSLTTAVLDASPTSIPETVFNSIRYVKVQIINYTHDFIFPPFTIQLGSLTDDPCTPGIKDRVYVETILPREALGVVCADSACTSLIYNSCPSP